MTLIAFGKSGWNGQYFAPSNFGDDEAKLIMSSLILWFFVQGLMAITITVGAISPEGLILSVFVCTCVGLVPILSSSSLMYIVLSRVDRQQAGALSYFLMIYAVQGMAFMAEFARHIHWLQIETIGKALIKQQQQEEQEQREEFEVMVDVDSVDYEGEV